MVANNEDDNFLKLLAKADWAKKTEAELYDYEMKLKIYRDYKNTVDTAFDEGKLEGKLEGEIQKSFEIARKMKHRGDSVADIAEMTGLSEADIDLL